VEVVRGEKLLEDRILSQSELDRRRAQWHAADKRRVALEEEHRRALAGARPEDLAIAAARVDEARARVSTAEHRLAKTRLLAPWAGSVVLRLVSAGDYVAEGEPVFELVDTEHLEIHVEVPGRLGPRLGDSASERTRVRVTIWRDAEFAIERDLDATIPAADEQARSFRAIVRPSPDEDPDRRLKPGMFVNVELLMAPVRDALVLPSDCVLASEGGAYVVRAAPAPPGATGAAGEPAGQTAAGSAGGGGAPDLVAEIVPVRVVAEADGRSAVESLAGPLAPGDDVILIGADNAFPGAALLPRELPQPVGAPDVSDATGAARAAGATSAEAAAAAPPREPSGGEVAGGARE